MSFRDIREGELEKELSVCKEISVSGITKEKGYCDPLRVLHSWHKQVYSLPDIQLGAYLTIQGAVNMAIENSNCHGGNELSLSMHYSDKGILVSVADNGLGFEVEETLDRFKRGKRHYNLAGQGFSSMSESPAIVYFNEKGNKTYLGYLIRDEEREKLIEKARKHQEVSELFAKIRSRIIEDK